ncbi:holo-[acyl-carrier-protein] synthase [Xylanibacillus composti]|uniref:Holo-[acyl-carrier-protein] synthase n=2 Tax=Xylanibacillus composti TaxID=1572762 RepID=A0A8J4H481_9BACL|nr:holo-[acyl-carrier-protein] synthase [Xylanibacillus composti]
MQEVSMACKTIPKQLSVVGIGIDMQSIEQLRQALERQGERMIAKVFTAQEREYCLSHANAAQHFAARWAVKEAFYKAMSGELSIPYRFVDVETRRTAHGKPYLFLYGALHEHAVRHRLDFHISLSHSGEYAAGIVLVTRPAEPGKELAT